MIKLLIALLLISIISITCYMSYERTVYKSIRYKVRTQDSSAYKIIFNKNTSTTDTIYIQNKHTKW